MMAATEVDLKPKARRKNNPAGNGPTACDQCYRCKYKCDSEKPVCGRCIEQKSACTYSTGKPLGKPKGSRNKVKRPWSNTGSQDLQLNGVTKGRVSVTGVASDNDLKVELSSNTQSDFGRVHDQDPSSSRPTSSIAIANGPDRPRNKVLDTNGSSHHSINATDQGTQESPYFLSSHSQHVNTYGVDPNLQYDATLAPTNFDLSNLSWPITADPTLLNSYASPILSSSIPAYHGWQTPAYPLSSPAIPQHSTSADFGSTSNGSIATFNSTPSSATACLCDRQATKIMSELHGLQNGASPIDRALQLAREGIATVSSYLSCPNCAGTTTATPSVLQTCILIAHQIFTWYSRIKTDGVRSRLQRSGVSHDCPIMLGDLLMDNEDCRDRLVKAVVSQELDRSRGVVLGLETCLHAPGGRTDRMTGRMLQTLREEIGWGTMC